MTDSNLDGSLLEIEKAALEFWWDGELFDTCTCLFAQMVHTLYTNISNDAL